VGSVLWHGERHRTAAGSEITCQVCHYQSVDPGNTGDSGFWWIDTTANYTSGGQGDCATCHTGLPSQPEKKRGKAWPLRHVNGRPDVMLDPRETLPPVAGTPVGTERPTRPYWFVDPYFSWFGPANAVVRNGSTTSFNLVNARWDRPSKTCSSVVCHVNKQSWRWGTPRANGCDCH